MPFLYKMIKKYVNNDTFEQDAFSDVLNIVKAKKKKKYLNDPEEFRLFLHLIKKIAKLHQKNSIFLIKSNKFYYH